MTELPISEIIRIQRYILRLSQSKLAEKAGVSRNYISKIEQGHTDQVTLKIIIKLFQALGLEMRVTEKQEVKP